MQWLYSLPHFFGGAFPTNASPHCVAGTMGRPTVDAFVLGAGMLLMALMLAHTFGKLHGGHRAEVS